MNTVNNHVRSYTDQLLDQYHPGNSLTFVNIETKRPSAEVRIELAKTSLGDALLTDGSSLSAYSDDEYEQQDNEHHRYMPNVHLYVNDRQTRIVGSAGLRVWGRGWDYSDGSWSREVDITFVHANTHYRQHAFEELKLAASSSYGPTISTGIFVPEYAETGYEGSQRYRREASEDDAMSFIAAVDDLRSNAG